MKRLWTGHKKYPVTDYVNLWSPTLTLPLKVDDLFLRKIHCLVIVNICSKYFHNPFMDKNLWTGHDIYNQMNKVHLELTSVILTLEVGVWLRITHRFIITHIFAKIVQSPLIIDKVMDSHENVTEGQTSGWTSRRTEYITISSFFFENVGDNKRYQKDIYKVEHIIHTGKCFFNDYYIHL
jgi:hypothetical protein